ncbi:hypothetical protein LINGRAHAP2_LOCUS7172 [Linum grandiflorum]
MPASSHSVQQSSASARSRHGGGSQMQENRNAAPSASGANAVPLGSTRQGANESRVSGRLFASRAVAEIAPDTVTVDCQKKEIRFSLASGNEVLFVGQRPEEVQRALSTPTAVAGGSTTGVALKTGVSGKGSPTGVANSMATVIAATTAVAPCVLVTFLSALKAQKMILKSCVAFLVHIV